MRVLVTGACGWTARAILARLPEAGHALHGLDLPGVEPTPESAHRLERLHRGSVARRADVEAAFEAARPEAVLHLAVAVGPGDYEDPERPFRTNVLGAYRVLDAARRHGARRALLLSSAPVHLLDAPGELPRAEEGWRSSEGGDHLYDLTKRLQEEIARDLAVAFGLPTVILRAGHIVDGRAGRDMRGRPLAGQTYARGGWVCRQDVARAVARALEADLEGCQAFDVVGASPGYERLGVARTEAALGLRLRERFRDA